VCVLGARGDALSERRALILTAVFCRSAERFAGDGADGDDASPKKRGKGEAEALSLNLIKDLAPLLEKFQAEVMLFELYFYFLK